MKQFIKFFLLGLSTYGLSIGLTFLGVHILGYDQKVVYAAVLCIITVINFFSSTKLIFESKNSLKIFIRYVFFLIIFTLGNYFLTQFGVEYFSDKYLYAIIFCVTTFIFGIKFIVYKKFVFLK